MIAKCFYETYFKKPFTLKISDEINKDFGEQSVLDCIYPAGIMHDAHYGKHCSSAIAV